MKGMKYAILCSALSLVFYYHNLMIGGGFWGYMAGIIYPFHLPRTQYTVGYRVYRDSHSDGHVFSVGVYLEGLSAGRRRVVDDDHRAHCGADGGLSAA